MKEKADDTAWASIDDLLAEAEQVHCLVIPWHGKTLKVYWQELTLEEMPSVQDVLTALPLDGADRDENLVKITQSVSERMVLHMILKGQKNADMPEKSKITKETFDRLPNRLKQLIVSEVYGMRDIITQRFRDGPMKVRN